MQLPRGTAPGACCTPGLFSLLTTESVSRLQWWLGRGKERDTPPELHRVD